MVSLTACVRKREDKAKPKLYPKWALDNKVRVLPENITQWAGYQDKVKPLFNKTAF